MDVLYSLSTMAEALCLAVLMTKPSCAGTLRNLGELLSMLTIGLPQSIRFRSLLKMLLMPWNGFVTEGFLQNSANCSDVGKLQGAGRQPQERIPRRRDLCWWQLRCHCCASLQRRKVVATFDWIISFHTSLHDSGDSAREVQSCITQPRTKCQHSYPKQECHEAIWP